jgi:hypothetical protein
VATLNFWNIFFEAEGPDRHRAELKCSCLAAIRMLVVGSAFSRWQKIMISERGVADAEGA